MSRSGLVLSIGFLGAAARLGVASGDPFVFYRGHYYTANDTVRFLSGRAGDMDADGYEDYVVGVPFPPPVWDPTRARVVSGLSGLALYEWTPPPPPNAPPPPWSGWGYSKAQGGFDLNQDGHDDVALVFNAGSSIFWRSGGIDIRSGSDGSLLRRVMPAPQIGIHGVGSSLTVPGDLNHDGWPDLVIGTSYGTAAFNHAGAVFALAGPALTVWNAHFGWHSQQGLSQSGAVGDVDGDGASDYAISGPGTNLPGGAKAGLALLVSGATGGLLQAWGGTQYFQFLGVFLVGMGDVDGDGVPDLAFSEFTASPFTPGIPPRVRVVSGATGATLRIHSVPSNAQFGEGARVEDANGDDVPELVLRWYTYASGTLLGSLDFFSGSSGAPLFSIPPLAVPSEPSSSRHNVTGLPDVNGDGWGDFGLTVGFDPNATPFPSYPTVEIWVARNFDVTGPAPTPGGSVTFQARAPRLGGQPFQVVLSLAPAFPGVAVGPFYLQVVPDALFWTTAAMGIGGSLDPSGVGSVTLSIPPEPLLQGLEIYATGVVFGAGGSLGIRTVLTRASFTIQ